MKIGFIGGGNMTEAIIKGMAPQDRKDIIISEPREERRQYLQQSYKVEISGSNKEVASSCTIIILAIKPQNMEAVLDEIHEMVTKEKTVVSIAAGIKLSFLSSRLKTPKIIRIMPNTPALIQEGISVMSLCDSITDKSVNTVREIFMSIGRLIILPEKQMDAVTALSGSGPAFFALFIESMIEGGIQMGLKRDDAITLTIQTAVGTSVLLDTGMTPSALREMVTSPGGTTAAGLKVFEEKGFQDTVIAAIKAAGKRSKELGTTG